MLGGGQARLRAVEERGTPPGIATRTAALAVEALEVEFDTSAGRVRAVDGVSWTVAPGQIMALVGESGCGKSVTALSVMRLLSRPAGRIVGGSIWFDGLDLVTASEAQMRSLRGRAISMVFQEPMASLNPVMTIGDQIAEPLILHLGLGRVAAYHRAAELLAKVGIADAERRLRQYPHHLSGGMRQRVMIAIAIACEPRVIIADEPTTALDVTIQAQILELLQALTRDLGIGLVLITHNLGIVARYADWVNVMYAGRIVEGGPTGRLFARPEHPYTIGLLSSVPRLDHPRRTALNTIEGLPPNLLHLPPGCRFAPRCAWRVDACQAQSPALGPAEQGGVVACHRAGEAVATRPSPVVSIATAAAPAPALLSVRGLTKVFEVERGRRIQAVTDVSFDVAAGETLGLVGESGCGKTTVGRMVLRLTEPTAGGISFGGTDALAASGSSLKALRRRIQVVFQDPLSSLNPRMTVGDILGEALLVHRLVPNKAAARARVAELVNTVGLLSTMIDRYPHQLSGGQRQRVGIARALAMQPEFIVLDEPVSALDVSIQGQIVNLLDQLQRDLGVGYLFIAHDLAVVRHLSHRIVVMYLGRVMEVGERDALYDNPLHPYTQALLSAAPVPDPVAEARREHRVVQGEIPSPANPPSGCVFRTRCPLAGAECAATVPPLRDRGGGRLAACIKI